jgi:transcriptional regulator with XRE-family HTH domain
VEELADKIGKSRATVYRYENGGIEKLPSSVLVPLALALNTTPADILDIESTRATLFTSRTLTRLQY